MDLRFTGCGPRQIAGQFSTVAAGQRTALVLDIKPRPGMHVYAPSASGYRPVTVSITPDPLIRLLPMQFPASEIYFFEPLKERVPVYQKPFTLLQEVVLEVTPQAEAAFRKKTTLAITGRPSTRRVTTRSVSIRSTIR